MIFAVDFDGTCVTHEFPKIGKDIGAAEVLKKLTDVGNKIILWTYRSNTRYGNFLDEAVDWFNKNNIPLYGVNGDPSISWSTSPKVNADVFIDDKGLGIPTIYNPAICNRRYVDWKKVEVLLLDMMVVNVGQKSVIMQRGDITAQ